MDKLKFLFVIVSVFQMAFGLVGAILRLDNESELAEARTALFNVDSLSGWVLLNYVSQNTVHFAAGGEGTASEVVPQLKDDQVQYVVVRVPLSEGFRDVFITWIGPEVGIIEKGKKTAHFGDAQSLLQPFHSLITAISKDNFNDETILDRSDPLSGSHVID